MIADADREQRCIQLGQLMGGIAGSFWGLMVLFGLLEHECLIGPLQYKMVPSIPSAIIGAFSGVIAGSIVARYLSRGHPTPTSLTLKGTGLGAISGALVLFMAWSSFYIIHNYYHSFSVKCDAPPEPILELIMWVFVLSAIVGGIIGSMLGLIYSVYAWRILSR